MTTWVLAGLNPIEPHVQNLVHLDAFHAGEAWTNVRRPQVAAMLDKRLNDLATWLGGKHYRDGRFTAGDLMMTCVRRELGESGILARFPTLDAYRCRGEERPSFANALAEQLAPFTANPLANA